MEQQPVRIEINISNSINSYPKTLYVVPKYFNQLCFQINFHKAYPAKHTRCRTTANLLFISSIPIFLVSQYLNATIFTYLSPSVTVLHAAFGVVRMVNNSKKIFLKTVTKFEAKAWRVHLRCTRPRKVGEESDQAAGKFTILRANSINYRPSRRDNSDAT